LLSKHRDVTDAHLLALAERRDGVLVTFDAHLRRLLGARPADMVAILH
jgi:predicted nucleic acid-binding protein